MRYFGSKATTAQSIYELVVSKVTSGSICDPFGGVGVVGAYFKSRGFAVCTGDVLSSAYHFQVAKIERDRLPSLKNVRIEYGISSTKDIVDLLNDSIQQDGWFVQKYSEERQFFTRENAQRIAGCRLLINRWRHDGLLSDSEWAVLTASLVNSMDKIANTAGTYYAYLKKWYRKSLLPFQFQLLKPVQGYKGCSANLCDARELVKKNNFDVLYLDPPYNHRCYASYYHLPETIAIGDAPKLYGKAGKPKRGFALSDFSRTAAAFGALSELIELSTFNLLVFQYSDDGLIPRSDIQALLSRYGRIEEVVVDAQGYTTSAKARTIKHRIYLVHHD